MDHDAICIRKRIDEKSFAKTCHFSECGHIFFSVWNFKLSYLYDYFSFIGKFILSFWNDSEKIDDSTAKVCYVLFKMLVSAYRNVMFSRLRYIFVCQDTHSSLIKLIKLPARQMKFLFNQKQIFLKTNLLFISLIKLKNELVEWWIHSSIAKMHLHCAWSLN